MLHTKKYYSNWRNVSEKVLIYALLFYHMFINEIYLYGSIYTKVTNFGVLISTILASIFVMFNHRYKLIQFVKNIFNELSISSVTFYYLSLMIFRINDLYIFRNRGLPLVLFTFFFVAIYLFVDTYKDIKEVLFFFLTSTFLLLFIALLNYYGYYSFPLPLSQGISLFTDRNLFVLYAFIGFVITLFISKKMILKIPYFILVGWIIVFSGSRRSLVFTIILASFYFIYIMVNEKAIRKVYKALSLVLLIFIATSFLSKFIESNLMNPNTQRLYSFFEDNLQDTGRRDIFKMYMDKMTTFEPLEILFGRGTFSNQYAFSTMNSPHNYLVTSFFDTGLIGLFLNLLYTMLILVFISRVLFNRQKVILKTLACIWTLIIYNYMITGYHLFNYIFFWFLTALTINAQLLERKAKIDCCHHIEANLHRVSTR